ncbi:MAG TPA: hypothetical protein VE442_17780 [Jatrophihabitans sp.]|jgi:predicted DNA-binding transcriptional regulator AlpA|nr:hypothetical protein [Jatrophihabitans sp.]
MNQSTATLSPDRLIGVQAAARKLGVDVDTLRHWHAHGAGPAAVATDSAELSYWSSDIEDWLDRLGMPGEPVVETLWRRLPNGGAVVRVFRDSHRGRVRFEIRRRGRVLARFASLPGVNAYLAQSQS